MGHITPSFRQKAQRQNSELKKSRGFQNSLIKFEHKKAVDLLVKEAWSAEDTAMSNSGIPYVLDVFNLRANVHTKRCNEKLRRKFEKLESILKNMLELENVE